MSRWFRSYGYAEVADRLLIGAYPLDAEDVTALAGLRVDRVLNLVEDAEYPPGAREGVSGALAEAGIAEARLSTPDFGSLPGPVIDAAVRAVGAWLDQGHLVYLHCRAGWQRSAALAAAVIASRDGPDARKALGQVQRRRPSADPLPHQREDLWRWWVATRRRAGGAEADPRTAPPDAER